MFVPVLVPITVVSYPDVRKLRPIVQQIVQHVWTVSYTDRPETRMPTKTRRILSPENYKRMLEIQGELSDRVGTQLQNKIATLRAQIEDEDEGGMAGYSRYLSLKT